VSRRNLGAEVARALEASGDHSKADAPIVVAWSGGLDSTVLLDLVLHHEGLRALTGPPIAAHLDHAMRPESAADARALQDTAAAWGVEFRTHRLTAPPTSESEARVLRYEWLEGLATDLDAHEIWTAHHADDQIETVLFRILRGTGVHGLEGIPGRRERIRRPFLQVADPVHRADLSAHADARALPIRFDASNDEPSAARNRLRHEVLPLLEEVVPGAGDALLRLARNAERVSSELNALVAHVLASDGLSADLWACAEPPLRRALLRGAARRKGVALSEAATLAAMDLPPDSQSGRGVDLPGGLRFEREFDRWRVFRVHRGTGPDAAQRSGDLEIPDPSGMPEGRGSGTLVMDGRTLRATWRIDHAGPDHLGLEVPPSAFPLTLRAWREGDRIRLSFGTTSVAKAWSESRVSRRERPRRWVLADRRGTLLAAEGLGRARSDDTIEEPRIRFQLRLDARP
jgi:tRNA(Ile)-lysidine synthetase-like protein